MGAAIDYASSTAGGLAAALAAGDVSALELTDAAITAIEAGDGLINAVVVRDFERARAAAREADAALARGETRPLLGVPMTVKEAHNVAGLPTTWGMAPFKDFVASTDSVGVARLKAAGAIIVGKTNVPPMLSDWQSANPIYGRTVNPLDHSRTPGGSSGGSAAALAAGFTPLEFGSDIGGSIRVPSHFCGTYGHKPSYDLVPQRGHTPPNTDGTAPLGVIGPMARTAADLRLALDILAGPAELEAKGYRVELAPPRHERLADFRVLILDRHPLAQVDGEILAAIDGLARRLEGAHAKVARESNLLPDLEAAHGLYMQMLNTAMSRGAPQQRDPPVTAHQWMNLLDGQLAVRRKWETLFESFDVVIAPTLGVAAFPHIDDDGTAWATRSLTLDGRPTSFAAQLAWPGMAVLAMLPATAFPIGRTGGGLPIGVQAMGAYLDDRTTIAFADLVERELG